MPSKNQGNKTPTVSFENEAWWGLSPSLWLLIIGLLLFNLGVFLNPKLLDNLFRVVGRLADFRLWPWYYFVFLACIVGFSVRWLLIYQAFHDEFSSPDNPQEMRAFLLGSGVITGMIFLYVVLRQTIVISVLYWALQRWFGVGYFTWLALLAFLLLLGVIAVVAALIWHWTKTLRYD